MDYRNLCVGLLVVIFMVVSAHYYTLEDLNSANWKMSDEIIRLSNENALLKKEIIYHEGVSQSKQLTGVN